jgi:hypothetical protein
LYTVFGRRFAQTCGQHEVEAKVWIEVRVDVKAVIVVAAGSYAEIVRFMNILFGSTPIRLKSWDE